MNFDWHMLYPLHTIILDNSRDFRGVPCRAQWCNFSKWFFSPRFGVVPIWELWQFWYVRKGPPKSRALQCQNIAAHPGESRGGVQLFVDGVLNCRAMYRFAVQQPKKKPLAGVAGGHAN